MATIHQLTQEKSANQSTQEFWVPIGGLELESSRGVPGGYVSSEVYSKDAMTD